MEKSICSFKQERGSLGKEGSWWGGMCCPPARCCGLLQRTKRAARREKKEVKAALLLAASTKSPLSLPSFLPLHFHTLGRERGMGMVNGGAGRVQAALMPPSCHPMGTPKAIPQLQEGFRWHANVCGRRMMVQGLPGRGMGGPLGACGSQLLVLLTGASPAPAPAPRFLIFRTLF